MQLQLEIMQTIMLYKSGQIFEWGQKQKTLEEVLEPLNCSKQFKGAQDQPSEGTLVEGREEGRLGRDLEAWRGREVCEGGSEQGNGDEQA